jgi:hypothetical protein
LKAKSIIPETTKLTPIKKSVSIILTRCARFFLVIRKEPSPSFEICGYGIDIFLEAIESKSPQTIKRKLNQIIRGLPPM